MACGHSSVAAEILDWGVEGDSCVSCRPVKLPLRGLPARKSANSPGTRETPTSCFSIGLAINFSPDLNFEI